MLTVEEFINTQKEAVALAASSNISYEEAIRKLTEAKEKEQEARRKAELELIESMGDKLVQSYDSAKAMYNKAKALAPDVVQALKDIVI